MTTQIATYSKAPAGQLEVIFTASVSASVSGDGGFPVSGAADVVLKCVAKDASGTVIGQVFVSRGSPSAHLILSYPGGSANWTVEVTDMTHSFGGGIGTVSATVQVTFILIKK